MNLESTAVPEDVLNDLLAQAHRAHDVIASALDRPFTIMTEGHAWTGPTAARVFADDLADRRTDLSTIATGLLDETEEYVRLMSPRLDQAA